MELLEMENILSQQQNQHTNHSKMEVIFNNANRPITLKVILLNISCGVFFFFFF